MTDTSGGTPPFTGFPGFGQADMMGKMWDLVRLNPFAAAAMPGGAQGVGPSLSMMSDMLAPLTNIEELDKRVADMRAVEQWLKLNLNMLQSAIQALEVQRATLATLRAFGAYAQTSVENAQAAAGKAKATGWPMKDTSSKEATQASAAKGTESRGADEAQQAKSSATPPGFDPSSWWNVLQSQFNQLASLAMIQPGAAAAGAAAPVPGSVDPAEDVAQEEAADAAADDASKKAPARKTAARKKPA
jgi:hypothetical protein